MVGARPVKSTVTPLESIFSAEETKKAATRVDEAIATRSDEIDLLNSFVDDNNKLVSLIDRLPEQLHHNIMVPFGSAAFFPGRLIHTNELMVLLGEGYYAEGTAKQTGDILRRRGKNLEAQIDSLKAAIADLQEESKFFDSTAAEAAEGLVEITEHYVEESAAFESGSGSSEPSLVHSSEVTKLKASEDDMERMWKRLDDLEKLELEDAAEDEELNSRKYGDANTSASFDDGRGSLKSDKSKYDVVKPSATALEPIQGSSQQFNIIPDSSDETDSQIPRRYSTANKDVVGSIVERKHGLLSSQSNETSSSSQPSTSNSSKPISRFKINRGLH